MQSKKNSAPKGISLTSLLALSNETDLSLAKKESLARLLIKVFLPKEYHLHKNRPFELPKDFRHIYSACLSLKEKSDEDFKKIHRVFLRCKENKWDKVSFFDISDSIFIILSTDYPFPEDLKSHLQQIQILLKNLDYLYQRYPYLLKDIFSETIEGTIKETIDETQFKKNILFSFSVSDKKKILDNVKIDTIKKNIDTTNPYRSKK